MEKLEIERGVENGQCGGSLVVIKAMNSRSGSNNGGKRRGGRTINEFNMQSQFF